MRGRERVLEAADICFGASTGLTTVTPFSQEASSDLDHAASSPGPPPQACRREGLDCGPRTGTNTTMKEQP